MTATSHDREWPDQDLTLDPFTAPVVAPAGTGAQDAPTGTPDPAQDASAAPARERARALWCRPTAPTRDRTGRPIPPFDRTVFAALSAWPGPTPTLRELASRWAEVEQPYVFAAVRRLELRGLLPEGEVA